MGFADTGKLGVAVRPRVYSDRLPKNVAQPGLEGKKLFAIGGVNPTIFNLDAALHAKITQSEYFKCLYVFKTFDKIVDLIYEKVSYVEPFTHRGASTKRSLQKQPSSAFCLLLKLFHLRLTEDQVRELLDHPDSTYLRVMGMLYVRYGTPAPGVAICHSISFSTHIGGDPSVYWKWLGEYCDDLEEFSPGIQQMHTTTVGAFARRLLTVAELDLYGTPLPPVGPILEYRFSVHLAAHDDVAKRAVVNKPRLPLAVGASGFLCCARDFYGEDDGEEDAIVWRADGVIEEVEAPYDGAPEGTLPRFKIKFSDGATAMAKLGMLRFPEAAKKKRSRSRRRDRRRSRSRKRDRAAPRSRSRSRDRGRSRSPPPRARSRDRSRSRSRGRAPPPRARSRSRSRSRGRGPPPRARSRSRSRGRAPPPRVQPPRSRSPRRFRSPGRDRSRDYRPARSPPPRRRSPSPRWRDRGRSPPRGSPRRRRSPSPRRWRDGRSPPRRSPPRWRRSRSPPRRSPPSRYRPPPRGPPAPERRRGAIDAVEDDARWRP